MNSKAATKLETLRSDYREVVGEPFQNFYCPILFRDEATDLCKAHLVNQAFTGSSAKWTIQRTDVDNFFGSIFESDFVAIRHKGKSVESFFDDPSSVKTLRPQTYVNGKQVEHYVSSGPIPHEHVEVRIQGSKRTVKLGLKMQPSELLGSDRMFLEVGIEKDCRLSALVSILKSAHLILFEMLGYQYALSAGGQFAGYTILGKFFMQNRGLSKEEILSNAPTYFAEYRSLVRPVLNPGALLFDPMSDRVIYICEGLSRWAYLIYVRTSDLVHAAIVPILDTPDAAARFVQFLTGDGCVFHARRCQFVDGVLEYAPVLETVTWPASNFS